jgi:hypothetical protein
VQQFSGRPRQPARCKGPEKAGFTPVCVPVPDKGRRPSAQGGANAGTQVKDLSGEDLRRIHSAVARVLNTAVERGADPGGMPRSHLLPTGTLTGGAPAEAAGWSESPSPTGRPAVSRLPGRSSGVSRTAAERYLLAYARVLAGGVPDQGSRVRWGRIRTCTGSESSLTLFMRRRSCTRRKYHGPFCAGS